MRLDEIKLLEEKEFLTNPEEIKQAIRDYGFIVRFKDNKIIIHEDGTVTSLTDITVSDKRFKRLPFKFREVKGNMILNGSSLATLKGFPDIVQGFLNISHNKLTSLEGGPSYVGSDYYCMGNSLTDLKGAPRIVGSSFNATDNILTTMTGAPKQVGSNFIVSNNHISDFKDSPQSVGGSYLIDNNEITSLVGIEDHVKIIGSNKKVPGAGNLYLHADNHFEELIAQGGLGLLLIDDLNSVKLGPIKSSIAELHYSAEDIINKYLNKSDKKNHIFDCQHELIQAGFESIAEL